MRGAQAWAQTASAAVGMPGQRLHLLSIRAMCPARAQSFQELPSALELWEALRREYNGHLGQELPGSVKLAALHHIA